MVPPLCSGDGFFVCHSIEEGEASMAFQTPGLSIRRPTPETTLILLRVETGSNRSSVFELCASFPLQVRRICSDWNQSLSGLFKRQALYENRGEFLSRHHACRSGEGWLAASNQGSRRIDERFATRGCRLPLEPLCRWQR